MEEESKKTLEGISKSAIAGLLVGGAVGVISGFNGSDWGDSEVAITTSSVVVGSSIAKNNNSEVWGYLVNFGMANLFYRIGYYSSRAIFNLLK